MARPRKNPEAAEATGKLFVSISMTDKVIKKVSSIDECDEKGIVIAIPESMQFPMAKKLLGNAVVRLYKIFRG